VLAINRDRALFVGLTCHTDPYRGMDLTPESRDRLLNAALRALRVRREALLLAGRASGHPVGKGQACRTCHEDWPCGPVERGARLLLEAVANLH
jgi:hypothetical protein